MAGCASARNEPATSEISLVEQVAAVHAGKSDRAQIEKTPVLDADLTSLRPEPRLTTLQLDHPGNVITAAGLKHLTRFPALEHLRIRGGDIGDEGLQVLAGMSGLRIVNLPQGKFSDDGLIELKRLPKLVQLRVGSPRVTDRGIMALKDFPALRRIHLIGVRMTDAGLTELQGMPRLESLYLDDIPLSEAALDALFQARPDLHVHLNQLHHDRDPHKADHPD